MERIKKIKEVKVLEEDQFGPTKVAIRISESLTIVFEKYFNEIERQNSIRSLNNPLDLLDMPHYLYVAASIQAQQILLKPLRDKNSNVIVLPHEINARKLKYYLTNRERATCSCGYTDPGLLEALDKGEEIYETTCPNCGQSRRVPGTGAPIFWGHKKKTTHMGK